MTIGLQKIRYAGSGRRSCWDHSECPLPFAQQQVTAYPASTLHHVESHPTSHQPGNAPASCTCISNQRFSIRLQIPKSEMFWAASGPHSLRPGKAAGPVPRCSRTRVDRYHDLVEGTDYLMLKAFSLESKAESMATREMSRSFYSSDNQKMGKERA
ncbi:uncharacterized protein LY89DRAFT_428384 [Mollisia scopiformis]|uniref:Uncharacterized protein n=1 Tax=Mollisia scopiformis TaxID=149040 RepID=A0A194XLW1_MOLSC|nr:uncharacterized protein LY89DRAFT_428384 [Mollisia scopiformis]KUJ21168.1 hypothetical protein LY89DRAFT_428384 [Mollisia scopiformis]